MCLNILNTFVQMYLSIYVCIHNCINEDIKIIEDKQEETENGSEDDLFKSRKRRRISYKVPTEIADDKEEETDDGSDDDLFKSKKRRRNSHKVPTECTICKKTYCSKSSQKEHMQV